MVAMTNTSSQPKATLVSSSGPMANSQKWNANGDASRDSATIVLSIDVAAPDCHNPRHPKPPAIGRAIFTITGKPDATIEEVVEELSTDLETTHDPSPQVCNLDCIVPQHTSMAVHEAPDSL